MMVEAVEAEGNREGPRGVAGSSAGEHRVRAEGGFPVEAGGSHR